MMFETLRSSTRGRFTAALALTPLLLALALLAGPKPAAAQQLWPDVNVYHSPNDDGVDPRSETCPPGCVCDGSGSGGTVTINFDDLDPYTVVSNQYPEATFIPDDTEIWAFPDAGSNGSSAPNWIQPMMDCDDAICTRDVVVDFTSPVSNLSFTAVPTGNDYGGATVDIYEPGSVEPDYTESINVDFYSEGTSVDLTAYSNVEKIHIRNVFNSLAYDNFTFDTAGGELDCVIDGGTNEEVELWINGGTGSGDGDLCKLPPDGDAGDRLCGADILIEITRGTGAFTAFRPRIDTLVHHPVCLEPPGDDEICPLPADTKRIRMNFRRGAGEPPLGPREVADLFVDSTGSTVGSPTTIVVSGKEAASANLQSRPIAEGGPETIAEGPVGTQEACVLECDFDGSGSVSFTDYSTMISHWGEAGASCTRPGPNPALTGDCDCSGGVGPADFNLLNSEWQKTCP